MMLKQILEIAKELETWIHKHTNENDYPNNPGLGLLQQSQDTCSALIILFSADLPGPAYALVRPMLDSYVGGLWLLNHASEEEIKRFLAGNKLPGFKNLLNTIGNDEETGGAWINKICGFNRKAFHGFTHGGIEHVLRRITDHSIQPHYPEEEQIRLMHLQIGIQFAIGCDLLIFANNQAEIKKLEEMAQQYGVAINGI